MCIEIILFILFILIFIFFIKILCDKKEKFINDEKIDLVYTWVSSECEKYNNIRKQYVESKVEYFESIDLFESVSSLLNYTFSKTNDSCNRLSNMNEIEYSIKSVKKNIPWINNIYIVLPKLHFEYFPVKDDNIILVAQEDLLKNSLGDFNPSFNSNAIELCFDEIPGLSNIFLYMNDDVIINKSLKIEDFYKDDKILVIYQKFLGLHISPYLASNFMNFVTLNNETSSIARYKSSLLIDNEKKMLVSHAPIIIDKKIYTKIKNKFNKEVLVTLGNKFRSSNDLVFPHYIYPHYMEKIDKTFNSKLRIEEVKWTDSELLNYNIVKRIKREKDNFSFLLINDERSVCDKDSKLFIKMLNSII